MKVKKNSYDTKSRILLFNLVCIPIRIGILLIVYFFPRLETISLTSLIALGFLYKYFKPSQIGFLA